MSDARLQMLARIAAVVSVCLAVCLLGLVALLGADASYTPSQSFWSSLPDVLMGLVYALVGVIVTLKRPSNLVGWALVLAGIGSLLGSLLGAYGELALLAKPDLGLPGGAAAAGLSAGSWTPLMAGVFVLLMTFPSGRVSSPRARKFTVLVLLGFTVVWIAISTSPGKLPPPLQAYENPLALTESKAYFVAVIPILAGCLLSVILAGFLALRRFRRSTGQERLQFKWLATSAGLLIVTLPFAGAFNWSRIAGFIFSAELIALPVSVGIAVLRYRLYEIDRHHLAGRSSTAGSPSFSAGPTRPRARAAGVLFLVRRGFEPGDRGVDPGGCGAVPPGALAGAAVRRPALLPAAIRRTADARDFGARLREQVDLRRSASSCAVPSTRRCSPLHVTLWLREGEA